MVELLGILVVDISVPLDSRNLGDLVNFLHADIVQGSKDRRRLAVLVEITSDDYVGE